jgi:toxin-antitoxin system PIN domain toxin
MIAPDANLLIYAYDPVSPFHHESKRWLEDILSSSEPVGIAVLSISGFLRFVTNPRIAAKPTPFHHASAIVDSWLAFPHVQILYPGDRYWGLFKKLGTETRASGSFTTDVSIAAIAQEYGATIHTNDRDFARFPNLRWHNPLTTS